MLKVSREYEYARRRRVLDTMHCLQEAADKETELARKCASVRDKDGMKAALKLSGGRTVTEILRSSEALTKESLRVCAEERARLKAIQDGEIVLIDDMEL